MVRKKYSGKKLYRIRGRVEFVDASGQHYYPLKDTIFERTHLSLWKWFFAIYLFSHAKNGVSAKELERQLGISYKAAWRVGKKIRELVKPEDILLDGIVEVDEAFIGGRKHFKRGKKKSVKHIVVGLVQREGEARAFVASDVSAYTLNNIIVKNVHPFAHVMTDEWSGYMHLSKKYGYQRDFTTHKSRQYVNDLVHTNGVECLWSRLKRCLRGTYHNVSKQHLQGYVDLFVFYWNIRKKSRIFEIMLDKI